MKVYHGGYCPIEIPEIIIGKYAKDFGAGFYCTELKEQAIRWARRYDTRIISIYNFEQNNELKMNLETTIGTVVAQAVETLYGLKIEANQIQLQKTKREFEGDLTVVIFPFVKAARKSQIGRAHV